MSHREEILELLLARIAARDWYGYLLFRKALIKHTDGNWILKNFLKRLPEEDFQAYTEYFRVVPKDDKNAS
jgi:hypothetical protein